MKEKIVIALGGNALQEAKGPATAQAQLEVVEKTCRYIAQIVGRGHEIAIVHGNGPQVGRILLASETARDVTPAMPFDVCGAMSQGYIGYHIQQAMKGALKEIGREDIPTVSLITQMVVDENDPGFDHPTKPIGPFYTREEAEELTEKGYVMKEDSGRGYRRVVASPIPMEIQEIDSVKRLWDSTLVVTCGGGGIPVIRRGDGRLKGVAAVIDKDFAAELLAEETDAQVLMILTEVNKVAIRYNQPDQEDLGSLTPEEAEQFAAEGHFAPGSMLPKVQAAVKFARSKPGRTAIITSLYSAVDALEGKTGTHIQA